MDTARCPACSAVVRTDADWCSLCYQDLRPPSTMISAASPAPAAAPINNVAALDATATDAAAIRPSSPDAHVPVLAPSAEPTGPDTASAAGWPCVCGNQAGFDQDECPACGSPFLVELRGANDGRHRVTGAFGARWNESRVFRFVVAGGVALLIAVGIPVVLTLLG